MKPNCLSSKLTRMPRQRIKRVKPTSRLVSSTLGHKKNNPKCMDSIKVHTEPTKAEKAWAEIKLQTKLLSEC